MKFAIRIVLLAIGEIWKNLASLVIIILLFSAINIITATTSIPKTPEEKAEDVKYVLNLVERNDACYMCDAIRAGELVGNPVCII